jgi:hypothetical protein
MKKLFLTLLIALTALPLNAEDNWTYGNNLRSDYGFSEDDKTAA